jgi:hypothetical protein
MKKQDLYIWLELSPLLLLGLFAILFSLYIIFKESPYGAIGMILFGGWVYFWGSKATKEENKHGGK